MLITYEREVIIQQFLSSFRQYSSMPNLHFVFDEPYYSELFRYAKERGYRTFIEKEGIVNTIKEEPKITLKKMPNKVKIKAKARLNPQNQRHENEPKLRLKRPPKRQIEKDFYIRVKNPEAFFDKLEKYYKTANKEYPYALPPSLIFQGLWVRAATEDFFDIERYLDKELQMVSTREVIPFYREEQEIGRIPFLHNKVLTAKSEAAMPLDENVHQMSFRLYNDDGSISAELPAVRYGIYEKDEKKVCLIGSIQNKAKIKSKLLERDKYKVNDGLDKSENSDLLSIEPKKVISYYLFLSLMLQNGIHDFEVRGLTTLDYNFHEILSRNMHLDFLKAFPDGKRPKPGDKEYTPYVADTLKKHDSFYQKQDSILKEKTEGMFNLTNRMLYHFQNGEVFSYPFETDSNFHFTIPEFDKSKVRGSYITELSDAISELDKPLDYTFDDVILKGLNKPIEIDKLENLSRHKSSNASFMLGLCYYYGVHGVKENKIKASQYFKRGLTMGDLKCIAYNFEPEIEFSENDNPMDFLIAMGRQKDREILEAEKEESIVNLFNEYNASKDQMDYIDETMTLLALFTYYAEKKSPDEIRKRVSTFNNKLLSTLINPIIDRIKQDRESYLSDETIEH